MLGMTGVEWAMSGGAALFVGLLALLAIPRKKKENDVPPIPLKKSEDDEFWDGVVQDELAHGPRIKRMLRPREQNGARKLGERLVHAGLYKRNSFVYFTAVRLVLMLLFPGIGLLLWQAGFMSRAAGLITGVVLGLLAMVGPSFYLDSRKKGRQTAVRRALPDALDVLNICLEGGMSLSGAFNKVTSELKTAHPLLAVEFAIIQREVQLGRTTGEALRNCAKRFDLEELRSLAMVVLQAERFGSGLVKALKTNAESLRTRRMQQAEEMAQKASVKILIPTVLLIFPALFVVILGPAAFDVYEMFQKMGQGN